MVSYTELQVFHMPLFFKQLKTYAFKDVTEALLVVSQEEKRVKIAELFFSKLKIDALKIF